MSTDVRCRLVKIGALPRESRQARIQNVDEGNQMDAG